MRGKPRPNPIVTYRPKPTASANRMTDRERQCIQVICDRDEKIVSLEFALKEVRRILEEEPSEIGTAIRIIEAVLPKEVEL